MAFIQILALAVLCVVTTADRHRRQDSSSVPILKFIDQHNIDGSYTYGFEAGDGTYKLETRLVSGEVKGKYGYIDPDGVLREMEYGATEERGFVSSLDHNDIGQPAPPPVQRNSPTSTRRNDLRRPGAGRHIQEQARRLEDSRRNDVRIPAAGLQVQEQARRPEDDRRNNIVDGKIRLVNGRRAVIRKRARKLKQNQQRQPNQPQQQIQLQQPQQPSHQLETRQKQLIERQKALAALQKARQELRELQQNQVNSFGSSQQVTNLNNFGISQQFSGFDNFGNQQRTSFSQQNQINQRQTPRQQQPGFRQQEAPRSQLGGRSFPQVQQPVPQQQHQLPHNVWAGHPAQNINLQDGSYSVYYSG